MSPSWRFREDKLSVAFREHMLLLGAEWIDLPADAFKSAGTGVRTGILKVRRRK